MATINYSVNDMISSEDQQKVSISIALYGLIRKLLFGP